VVFFKGPTPSSFYCVAVLVHAPETNTPPKRACMTLPSETMHAAQAPRISSRTQPCPTRSSLQFESPAASDFPLSKAILGLVPPQREAQEPGGGVEVDKSVRPQISAYHKDS